MTGYSVALPSCTIIVGCSPWVNTTVRGRPSSSLGKAAVFKAISFTSLVYSQERIKEMRIASMWEGQNYTIKHSIHRLQHFIGFLYPSVIQVRLWKLSVVLPCISTTKRFAKWCKNLLHSQIKLWKHTLWKYFAFLICSVCPKENEQVQIKPNGMLLHRRKQKLHKRVIMSYFKLEVCKITISGLQLEWLATFLSLTSLKKISNQRIQLTPKSMAVAKASASLSFPNRMST